MRRRCLSGAEIVVNLSASPYRLGIHDTRREMLATRAADNQTVLLYANAVGAQDGLVYDGGGFLYQNGRLVHEAARFVEATASAVVDLDRTRRLRMEHTTWRADCEAFVLGARPVPVIRSAGDGADTSRLTYPLPAGGSFFLPAPSAAAGGRARRRARRAVRGAGPGRGQLLHQDRRLPVARPGAVGRPRLDADAAGGVAGRRPHPGGGRRRRRRTRPADHRLLHADPALAGRDPHRRARAGRRARRRAPHHPARRGLRPRGGGHPADARRATAGGADASERSGAAAWPADVELGQQLRRALPADR